jgi:hypothetical protein
MRPRYCPPSSTTRAFFRALLLLVAISFAWSGSAAQSLTQAKPDLAIPAAELKPAAIPSTEFDIAAKVPTGTAATRDADPPRSTVPQLRLERRTLSAGAELLTIFGRLDGIKVTGEPAPEVPLLSVVRDTLGDDNPENDRLRYVWMLTYTRPTMLKRLASAVPFLYHQVGNQRHASGLPTPILDMSGAKREMWNRFFWYGLQHAFFDTYGIPLRASSRSYRQNMQDYRNTHLTQALAVLGTYKNLQQRDHSDDEFLARNDASKPSDTLNLTNSRGLIDMKPSFTVGEMLELRARLLLSQKFFGGLYGPEKFHHMVESFATKSIDNSGHNWELLRQQAEADGLYFEPLTMPDGSASHAIVWISKSDLTENSSRRFSGRFLNFKNPWTDQRLRKWTGYSETRFFDSQNRRVTAETAGGRRVEMIPLAVYGLHHPRIPALLIDFRSSLNAKKREMSGRLFNDVARNVLSLSSFGNLPYLAGRKTYGFLTGRRGMDLNQPSRVRSYAELKLLLSFNSSINPSLREELESRLEHVSLNPLSNDADAEIELAQQQYDALIAFATREDGLPAKIERDRRAEIVPLVHGSFARFMFGLGNVLTFGRYIHREEATPELDRRMEMERRIEHHVQFLKQVADSSPQIEVVWELADVRASLRFLADQNTPVKGSAGHAAALVFQRTSETETRVLCLDVLSRINDKSARKEMLRLFQDKKTEREWLVQIADRLRAAVAADPQIKEKEADAIRFAIGQK